MLMHENKAIKGYN